MVGHTDAMVTCYITKIMFSLVIRQFFDTMIVESNDYKE